MTHHQAAEIIQLLTVIKRETVYGIIVFIVYMTALLLVVGIRRRKP